MASLDSALLKKALQKSIVRRVTNDLAVGLRLRYIGTGHVDSVATTTGTDVTLTTSDGGADIYLFSAHSTLGSLSDAINADGIFECKVMDALRSENPDDFFVTNGTHALTTDDNGVGCYELLIDTNTAATMACVLSPHSNFDAPKGHRVHLQQVGYLVDNTSAFDTLTITQRKGTVETVLYAAANTDNSAATLTFASGEAMITADWDAELVVQFDGTVANAATGYIELLGIYE
jgi:hypothetical protein